MSRSTESVTVLFHENDRAIFDQLEKHTGSDIVLDKLSKSTQLSEIELEEINSQLKLLQAIKTIIVNKDLLHFRALLPLIAKFKNADFYRSVQNLLASCFTWCKDGSILEMLRLFRSETETEMSEEDGWTCLCHSLCFVQRDWNQASRRTFLANFLEITQLSFKNFKFKEEDDNKVSNIILNCWIAENENLLRSLQVSQPVEVHFIFVSGMLTFHFDKKFFQTLIETLFGGRAIHADAKFASKNLKVPSLQQIENFDAVVNLLNNSALEFYTEHSSQLIFKCFEQSSFDQFKIIFMRTRQANIPLSEILTADMRNIFYSIGWGDCGVKKAHLVLQEAFEQKNGELEKLLTQRDKDGMSVLFFNCFHGKDPMIVELLLQYAKPIWDRDICEDGKTVIHAACIGNQIAILEMLLKLDEESSYEITKKASNSGEVCLHCACLGGNTTIVKMLLNIVPEMALQSNFRGSNPFHYACRGGHLETAQTMYKFYSEEGFCIFKSDVSREEGVNYFYDNKSIKSKTLKLTDEEKSRIEVYKSGQNAKSKPKLCESEERANHSCNGTKPERRSSSRLNLITGENSQNARQKFTFVSESNGNLKQKSDILWSFDENGESVLHLAAGSMTENVDLVKWIVSLDRNLLYRLNNLKQNALHVACKTGKIDHAKWLFEQEPTLLQGIDEAGNSVLHLAVGSPSIANVDLLKWIVSLDRNLLYSLNIRNQNALEVARCVRQFAKAEWLLEQEPSLLKGIDEAGYRDLHLALRSRPGKFGRIVRPDGKILCNLNLGKQKDLHIACRKGQRAKVKCLLEQEPKLLQVTDGEGNSILHAASFSGNVDLVKWLVSIDPSLVYNLNNREQSALHVSCSRGHMTVSKWIHEQHPDSLLRSDVAGNTVLHLAVGSMTENVDLVRWIVSLDRIFLNGLNKQKQNALHVACGTGQIAQAKCLIELDPTLLQSIDGNGNSVLHAASFSGNVDLVKWVVSLDPSLLYTLNNREQSALHVSCSRGHMTVSKWIHEQHPDSLLRSDVAGNTVLHLAVGSMTEKVDLVRWIVSLDRNLLYGSNNLKQNALHIACDAGQNAQAKWLLQQEPNLITGIDEAGNSVLHLAAGSKTVNLDLLEWIVSLDRNLLYGLNKRKQNVLHVACSTGQSAQAKWLLEQEANLLQGIDEAGNSVLHLAVLSYKVNENVIKWIVSSDRNLLYKLNNREQNALQVACCTGQIAKAVWLLEQESNLMQSIGEAGHGNLHSKFVARPLESLLVTRRLRFPINILDRLDYRVQNVLHVACGQGDIAQAKVLLVQQPKFLRGIDEDGNSVLHSASSSGNLELVKWLVSLDPKILYSLNDQKRSALHVSCSRGHLKVSKWILKQCPNSLLSSDGAGNSVLHLAVGSKRVNVNLVKWIVSLNRNLLYSLNNRKQNALHVACGVGQNAQAKWLIEQEPNLTTGIDEAGNSVLHLAAGSKTVNLDLLERIVGLDRNLLYSLNKRKQNALHVACVTGQIVEAKWFFEQEPNLLQGIDDSGNSVLHLSVGSMTDNVDLVKWIMSVNRNLLYSLNNRKQNALHAACSTGQIAQAIYLLEQEPKLLQGIDERGNSVLHLAVGSNAVNVGLLEWIVNLDRNLLYSLNNQKQKPLEVACCTGKLAKAKWLLEQETNLLQGINEAEHNDLHLSFRSPLKFCLVRRIVRSDRIILDNLNFQKQKNLHVACCIGQSDKAKFILEQEPNLLYSTDDEGNSVLHAASFSGNVGMVKWLLSLDPNLVYSLNDQKQGALHVSCSRGHWKVSEWILKQCPNSLLSSDGAGNSVLHLAVGSKRVNVNLVKWIVSLDRNLLYSLNNRKQNALHVACSTGPISQVKCLFEQDPTLLQSIDEDGNSVLHAASFSGNVDLVKWLVSLSPNLVYSLNNRKQNALHTSCENGNMAAAECILKQHPDSLLCSDEAGNNVLHLAVGSMTENADLVKWIVSLDRNFLYSLNKRKQNALHVACGTGQIAQAKCLIELDPTLLQSIDGNGNSVLHAASFSGNVDLVKWVVSLDPSLVYSLNHREQSALHTSCSRGHMTVSKWIHEQHPDSLLRSDVAGNTVLHLAVGSMTENVDLVRWIVSLDRIFLNGLNKQKQNALHVACGTGQIAQAKCLIELDPTLWQSIDGNGNSVLHAASFSGNVELVKWVVSLDPSLLCNLNNREQSALHVSCSRGHMTVSKWIHEQHPDSLLRSDVAGNTVLHLAVGSKRVNVNLVKWIVSLDRNLL